MKLAIALVMTATTIGRAAGPPPIGRFLEAASADDALARAALAEIAGGWKDSYTALLVDLARFLRAPRRLAGDVAEPILPLDADAGGAPRQPLGGDFPEPVDRGSPIRRRLVDFLEKQTGRRLGQDLNAWRDWMWTLPEDPHPDHAAFKAAVYGRVDPRMRAFFPDRVQSRIRLDEIDWGGVRVNGIPPLRYPRFVAAGDAGYVRDSNVVFGIIVNGEAKAYPKRILAWHEMATDTIGGVDMTIVYCTLCGTVIPFESRVGGQTFVFGTSGLLYRSNKLMFDQQTNSLWSTFEGEPVVGALVGSSLKLVTHSVVTTTWKEWRTEHPDTGILSIDTGYERDYSEGAAYRDYFATDRLMFHVSRLDARLPRKAEVLVMQLVGPANPDAPTPVAIDARVLRRRRVFTFDAAGARFVVVTSAAGANRVYRTDVDFAERSGTGPLVDVNGRRWQMTEPYLTLEQDASVRAPRVSAQRAFWFGWYAQFPHTRLIK